jgi:hypothetical protein
MTPSCARRWSFAALTLAGAAVLALLPGCSGRAAVSGNVTCDGAPLDGGRITFIPEGGKAPVASGPIVGGKYSLSSGEGPVRGKHRVEIVWNKKTGKKVTVPGDVGNEMDETVQVIHADYNSGSTLSADVKSSGDRFDFAVKAYTGQAQGGKVRAVGD